MDLSSSKSSWIWAFKDGPAISSNDLSTTLHQHTNQGSFTLDLTKAQGGNSADPFVNTAVTATAAGGSSPTAAAAAQSPSGSSDSSSGGSSGGASGDSSGGSSADSSGGSSGGGGQDPPGRHQAVLAHGALMGVAFVALFPLGAIAVRVLSFRGLIWFHAATQIFAYTLALAGMGLGVWIATKPDYIVRSFLFSKFQRNANHTIHQTDKYISSSNWPNCYQPPCVPTRPRPRSSLHVQAIRPQNLLDCVARVGRSCGHHPGDHKRWFGDEAS